jgi:hypothetical protein
MSSWTVGLLCRATADAERRGYRSPGRGRDRPGVHGLHADTCHQRASVVAVDTRMSRLRPTRTVICIPPVRAWRPACHYGRVAMTSGFVRWLRSGVNEDLVL